MLILRALLALPVLALASQPSSHARRGHHLARREAASLALSPRVAAPVPVLAERPFSHVVAGWYTSWHAFESMFPPEKVDYSKYNVLAYAFLVPARNVADTKLLPRDNAILRKLVRLGHAAGVKITISVGGGAGSQFFSTAVRTKASRAIFIDRILDVVETYHLDGIDMDWEFPNMGLECNQYNSQDTPNFLLLLKEIRASPRFPKQSLLTAAVMGGETFLDTHGRPSKDVSEFAKVLDWIEVMNYDVWGYGDVAGPNSPLDDRCVKQPWQAAGSAITEVKGWMAAGFGAHQIVLGLAMYSHSSIVKKNIAFGGGPGTPGYEKKKLASIFLKNDPSRHSQGDRWSGKAKKDFCGVFQPADDTFNFWGLIEEGFLTKDGLPAPGISFLYDTCSQTPAVYKPSTEQLIEYESAQSMKKKGEYIRQAGLNGMAFWEVAADSNNILINAAREGAQYGLTEH